MVPEVPSFPQGKGVSQLTIEEGEVPGKTNRADPVPLRGSIDELDSPRNPDPINLHSGEEISGEEAANRPLNEGVVHRVPDSCEEEPLQLGDRYGCGRPQFLPDDSGRVRSNLLRVPWG